VTDLVVRPIEPHEIAEAISVLIGGSNAPEYEDLSDLDAYRNALVTLRERDGDVLVALTGTEVIGLCQYMVLQHFQHRGGRCTEVESVHVRSDWRRRGVGAALIAAVEERSRDAGCYRIQLTSNRSRDAAHLFYPALGFEGSHVGYKKHLGETLE
jgi:GNAT superfamily N-acetyltransferase